LFSEIQLLNGCTQFFMEKCKATDDDLVGLWKSHI
jgi:hypothetical protein